MAVIWAKQGQTDQGWVADLRVEIEASGRIAGVRTGQPAEGHRVGILLPAPVNVHSHAFQRAMAGLTERRGPNPTDSFWTWRKAVPQWRVVIDGRGKSAAAHG